MILKRIVDIVFTFLGLILLIPVLVLIALWIRLDSPGPILFRQSRLGRFGIPFTIYKFRTMNANSECLGPQVTAGKDERITRSGAFLRRHKLDELPQLLNVLLGDMSIVGPRPEVPAFADKYKKEYEYILTVRPGLTDWAAIEFSDEEQFLMMYEDTAEGYIKHILPRKLVLYKKYIDERTLLIDFEIIFLTLCKIFMREKYRASNKR